MISTESTEWNSTDSCTQTLTFKLMPKIDDVLKADVVKWSAFYEHRIRNGSVCDQFLIIRFERY